MPNIVLALSIVLVLYGNACAQEHLPARVVKKYRSGMSLYRSGQPERARATFEKILKDHPDYADARLQLGSVCFDLEDYACAETQFLLRLQLPDHSPVKIHYTLGLAQYRLGKFALGRSNVERFLTYSRDSGELRQKAEALLAKLQFAEKAAAGQHDVQLHELTALNTDRSEYLPCVRPDGKAVYFTRRSPRGDEDLYFSERTATGWTVPVPLSGINTPQNEGAPAISPDGKTLVFTSCDRQNGLGGCDLYRSIFREGEWSVPVNMGSPVNTPAYESHPCFAENGNALYFASNRKGGRGGSDLWMTRLQPNGTWGNPKNLGDRINTSGNEVCPFAHANGAALHFASDGHPGMGGKDLFITRLDASGDWGVPENLSMPVNTIGDESSWTVFPDGLTAWMASDRKYLAGQASSVHPNLDLFALELPEGLRIDPSCYLQVKVLDRFTRKVLAAEVRLFDLNAGQLLFAGETDAEGVAKLAFPKHADCALHVYQKGYALFTEKFRGSEIPDTAILFEVLALLTPERESASEAFVLHNIFFASGSDSLRGESTFELDALLRFLTEHPSARVRIEGHTDDVGSEADNQTLSEKRAQAVVRYLVNKGVRPERLEARGYGESRPVAPNDDPVGRSANRRICFTLLDRHEKE
ncbi:MAG: PD40 domain-containing protein [Saprospiraceae bacterium]|nr:PD40 domain-containing protein [Saprospiraceae bacterium]